MNDEEDEHGSKQEHNEDNPRQKGKEPHTNKQVGNRKEVDQASDQNEKKIGISKTLAWRILKEQRTKEEHEELL